jgi:hypothetical protein
MVALQRRRRSRCTSTTSGSSSPSRTSSNAARGRARPPRGRSIAGRFRWRRAPGPLNARGSGPTPAESDLGHRNPTSDLGVRLQNPISESDLESALSIRLRAESLPTRTPRELSGPSPAPLSCPRPSPSRGPPSYVLKAGSCNPLALLPLGQPATGCRLGSSYVVE